MLWGWIVKKNQKQPRVCRLSKRDTGQSPIIAHGDRERIQLWTHDVSIENQQPSSNFAFLEGLLNDSVSLRNRAGFSAFPVPGNAPSRRAWQKWCSCRAPSQPLWP